MPYIAPEIRERFKPYVDKMLIPENCGELNYLLSVVCIEYMKKHGESYQNYNDIHGVLTCMNLEFYRRKTSLYENEKSKQNGDVFTNKRSHDECH